MSQQAKLAQLISYSQPPKYLFEKIGQMDLLQMIVYIAKVSNPAKQHEVDTPDRLINYLIRNKHWSPFEMVSICLEINTTRDIARQILRHRSFSYQEYSQRYAVASQMGMTFREARLQDDKNRQNSIETDDVELHEKWIKIQQEHASEALAQYQWALDNGIAKEVARAVLPEGNTNSRLYMNGTLRSWIHYIQLRSANGTQKEHREVALACGKEIYKIFPHESILFGD